MKIKLHNKYEIKIRNKTYTAYNTLLKNVYSKITNLEQFTSHIALGTGTTAKTYTDTKLGSYARTYAAQTEEINADIASGTPLYIKKLVTLDDTNQDSFSFSELGLASVSTYDPDIYNHVLLTDENDNVLTISRDAGEPIEIRVTIYLELTSLISNLFVPGENKLIKRLLGDDFATTDNHLYAIRGNCLDKTKYIKRTLTDLTDKKQFNLSIAFGNDQDATITATALLGEGETQQVFVVYDGEICMRYPTLELVSATNETSSDTPVDGIIEVDDFVKTISSVTGTNAGAVANVKSVTYSKILSDKLTNLFDQTYTSSTRRVISKDGQTIAFITNSGTNIYRYQDYAFTKINSTLVPHSGVLSMEIYGNYIICTLSQSPYVEVFEIISNNAVKEDVHLNYYALTSYTYDWLHSGSVLTENNKILIGVVLNTNEQTPLLLTLTKGANNEWSDSQIIHPTLDWADKVCSLYKNQYNSSMILFLTSKYSGSTTYLCEEFTESSSAFNMNSVTAYAILNGTAGIQTGGRIIMSEKSSSPYLKLYYAPDYDYAGDNFSSSGNHYLSYDGNYLAYKDSQDAYHIYNTHQKGEKDDFDEGFPTYVNQAQITDLAFVGDMLLVFTSNQNEPLYAIALQKTYTRIEDLSDQDTYTTLYQKYALPGNNEGVKITLTFNLGEEEEEE
ncbi:MAG: hypothetical protein IJS74_00955, partial [Clostridia bacterium]|nr:hypothetical protein [Clostridia bacterium]